MVIYSAAMRNESEPADALDQVKADDDDENRDHRPKADVDRRCDDPARRAEHIEHEGHQQLDDGDDGADDNEADEDRLNPFQGKANGNLLLQQPSPMRAQHDNHQQRHDDAGPVPPFAAAHGPAA